MNIEQQRYRESRIDPAGNPHIESSSWTEFRLSVPNDHSDASIVTFVDRVLVALTLVDVRAEYVSMHIWGVKRTQFVAIDDDGERFRKRHYNERLGWYEEVVSRRTVREEVVNRLSLPSSLTTDWGYGASVDESSTFAVTPRHQLEHDLRSR